MADTDMGGMCECEIGDCDPVTVFEHRHVVVRKGHKCCECGRKIQAGTECDFARYKLDGDFYRDYTCLPCVGISRDFLCGQRGDIRNLFIETYGFDPFA